MNHNPIRSILFALATLPQEDKGTLILALALIGLLAVAVFTAFPELF